RSALRIVPDRCASTPPPARLSPLLFSILRPPPRSPLFPYTTLFRSPRADRLTLVRRAYMDLIGLPPTPSETEEFLSDNSPEAWGHLIDKLLASPHYGERWGRHWLDVARYADSDGFEQDFDRPNAWLYRD